MVGAPIRVVFVGLGPIGLATFRMVADRKWARIVGAVDVADEMLGRDAGVLAGIDAIGVPVVGLLEEALPADVVVLCTTSRAEGIEAPLIEILDNGASVVTTCEELSFPWFHHPEIATRIDSAARRGGQAVLGTGVNPGFAMDAAALFVSGACERVDSVDVLRVVDASTRRGPLQKKVGAGIDEQEFAARRAAGAIGHAGLVESAAMVAAAFGWSPDEITETLEPVLAIEPVVTDHAEVAAGSVAGIRQIARCVVRGEERVKLHLDMYVGAQDPGDTITLKGSPPTSTVIKGLHGDVTTAAITVNAIRALGALPPGLMTMLDTVPVHWYPPENTAG